MQDERLTKINQERDAAIAQSNDTYNQILQDNQNLYNQQQQYTADYQNTQNEILDKQLQFQEDKINQQKEIARQNMETEQKKARNDYTQFINPYGYRNENLAERGLAKSGVSETSMLGGFNTYQNRLASANKAMQDAFVQYDNDINQARLNNDVQKAQNALNALKMNLEFAETFYTNKSNTMQNQLSNSQSLNSDYYNRYQTEYGNIQAEKERAEKIRQWEAEMAEKTRQYNETLAFQKSQAAQEQANWEKEYALAQQAKASSGSRSSGGSKSSSSSKKSSSGGTTLTDGNSNSGDKTVKSTYCPNLSSGTAIKFFNTLKTSYKQSELESKLVTGYKKGQITEKDFNLILGAYGIKN